MSKGAAPPPQKGNFIQFALIMMVIFMGYQLFFGQRNVEPDNRTTEEVLAKMRELNLQVMDLQIQREFQVLQNGIREDVREGRLEQEAGDALLMEGLVLTADTQFKGGLIHNDGTGKPGYYKKVDRSFQTMQSWYGKYHNKEVWNEPFEVAPKEARPETSVSAESLYGAIVTDLSERNKSRRAFGLVPGGYQILDGLVRMTGSVPSFSYWFAALVLALLVRLSVWPLFSKQIQTSRKQAQLLPQIKEIQAKYKEKGPNTGMEMQKELQALYQQYGVNPAAGCLIMFVLAPLFITIYNFMLLYRFEFQKGTFLWINPDSTTFMGLEAANNLGQRDPSLIILYGVSMIVTTMLQPVTDPQNVRTQRLLGLGMSVFFSIIMFFYPLPSAFILYWIFTNVFATAHTLIEYRKPAPPLVKVASAAGGVIPTESSLSGNGKPKEVDPNFLTKTSKSTKKPTGKKKKK